MSDAGGKSYSDIVKSSTVFGGATVYAMALGLIRTKLVAVLIGPVGVGLAGTYQAVGNMITNLSGLGLARGAMRDLAAATSEEDEPAISRIVTSMLRCSWLCGLAGAVLLATLAPVLGELTFGNDAYRLELTLLGLVVLLANVSVGQQAVIQGLRRIGDLARVEMLHVTASVLLAGSLYAWLGLRGIIPFLVASGLVQVGFGGYLVRRAGLVRVDLTWAGSMRLCRGFLPLGLSLMWTALLAAILAWLVRLLINQEIDLAAVGVYLAAFTLAGISTDFLLGAMSADYQPRLAQHNQDPGTMVRLVNEQTELGLLMALPGLMVTLVLAPWVVPIVYTGEFAGAVPLLQWFALGCIARMVSWPMGFVPPAMRKAALHAVLQTSYQAIHLGLIIAGLTWFGLEGVAMAFCTLFVISITISHQVLRRLIGFHWNRNTGRLIVICMLTLLACFLGARHFDPLPFMLVGLPGAAAVGVVCLRAIVRRLGGAHSYVQQVLRVPGMRLVCGL